jgi:hypothetical protein
MESGNVNYNQLETRRFGEPGGQKTDKDDEPVERHIEADSLITDQHLDMDFEIERKILQEKK